MDDHSYAGDIIIFEDDESASPQAKPDIQELKDKGREAIIVNVLTDMVHCNIPLHEALETQGVTRQTWYDWRRAGHLDRPQQQMRVAVQQLIQDTIYAKLSQVIERQVEIALGQSPEGTEMAVKPNHMTAAFKVIMGLMNEVGSAEVDRSDDIEQFLKEYKPPQTFKVTRTTETMEFLYADRSRRSCQTYRKRSLTRQTRSSYNLGHLKTKRLKSQKTSCLHTGGFYYDHQSQSVEVECYFDGEGHHLPTLSRDRLGGQ